MSLAKLTSLSTQTLSLLLERQRLSTFAPGGGGAGAKPHALHLPQITRNLRQLRAGVLALEEQEGRTEAVALLRTQYARMCGMLGADVDLAAEGLDPCAPSPPRLILSCLTHDMVLWRCVG
jgi:syntaxin 8